MDTVARRGLGFSISAVLLLTVVLVPPAAAEPWQLCGNSGNYTANSTYQLYIQRLEATLPKVASSGNLFATDSAGADPEVVYALALCRGDANATTCGSCVATAFQDAQKLCAYNKDASVFYNDCYLRFSNQDFLTSTTNV